MIYVQIHGTTYFLTTFGDPDTLGHKLTVEKFWRNNKIYPRMQAVTQATLPTLPTPKT